MSVQVILREGQPEYAVLPWDEYQALLSAAGQSGGQEEAAPAPTPTGGLVLERLAALREGVGMSQAELARSVGISPSNLAMIEQGEREPDDAIRRSLARVLGVATEGV